jgi:hypothetical protein
MDPLFPELPEDLATLNDEELGELLAEHQVALEKVEAEDEDYVGGLSADEVLVGMEQGVEQIKKIKDEQAAREEAAKAYQERKAQLLAEARFGEEEEKPAEGEGEGETEGEGEAEGEGEEGSEEEVAAAEKAELQTTDVVQQEPVTASTTTTNGNSNANVTANLRVYRRPAAPAPERQVEEGHSGAALVAASGVDGVRAGETLDRIKLAEALIEAVKRRTRPIKHEHGVEEKILIASAAYDFPPERTLRPNDIEGNNNKIRSIGNPFLGVEGQMALTASGGLCAPLTPLYDIPDFAVTDRPVRDSLPSFAAERGGISVPSVSTIGSITSAITVIEESADAQGGTFATKSCQDLDCPTWTDVAVGIISHCREYGNLNARAWPEGIAHENNLTMAAHARTAEARLLDRIKALSINVTTASVYNGTFDLVYAIVRAAAGIRYRLRLGQSGPALRALLPVWVLEFLVADNAAQKLDDHYKSRAEVTQILRDAGVEPAFYLDTPSTGTTQGFADEAAGTLDNFPTVAQWALYVEGEFLHLDGGTLELGLVRDSTLNSTNDYQVFGETFENVARIGPTQGALWVTSTICPDGTFPADTTALTCP